jgi:hypothetical protein
VSDPIVDPSDLATYLGVAVDEDRATLLIGYAQALCEAIVSPLPAGAKAVVTDVAVRAYSNPMNVQAQTAGQSVTFGAVSGGLWLTNQNKATLRLLSGGTGGAFTIDTMPATAGQNLPWWDIGSYGPVGDWDLTP